MTEPGSNASARRKGRVASRLVVAVAVGAIAVIALNSARIPVGRIANVQFSELTEHQRPSGATRSGVGSPMAQREPAQRSTGGDERSRVTLMAPATTTTTLPEVQLLACGLDETGWPAATVQVVSRQRGRVDFVVNVRFLDAAGNEFSEGFAFISRVGLGVRAIDVASSVEPAPPESAQPECEMVAYEHR